MPGRPGEQGIHPPTACTNLCCAHVHSQPVIQILRRYVPSDGIKMLVERRR
jgi:hypothetical protein